jgi:CO/xanthine dehydrogenase Mo-binding subunit
MKGAARPSDENVIGRSVLKEDARDKVTGGARYAADLWRPAMLYGKAVRATHAHAIIRKVDSADALRMEGVRAIITASDIPGKNRIGMTGAKDQRVLAEDRVRFWGEAVALVAAVSPELADEACRRVKIEYEPLPVLEDPETALRPDAPVIGEKGNLCVYRKVAKGDCERALAEAEVVVEGEYRTSPVEHAYIEPEAVLVEPTDNGIFVWSSTKSVHLDQAEIAGVLGWPLDRIGVAAPVIGGSFGGKSDLALNAMASLLAVRTKASVAMGYDREESFQVSTKRHACVIRYKHGARKDGTLTAVKMDLIADAGAYNDYTSVVLPRMAIHGAGPYRVPNVMLEVRGVHTNNPVSGAMRGFGQPQVAFGCERQMDRLAAALGMDPWDLRLKNALEDGDTSATGQVLQGVTMRGLLEEARARVFEDESVRPAGDLPFFEKEAWGMACFHYGNGRTGLPNPGVADGLVDPEGLVRVCVGSPDIGQGSTTVLGQITAAAMGISIDHVKVVTADTRCTPDSGTTSGTRLTAIVGNAVKLVARRLKEEILQKAAKLSGIEVRELSLTSGPEGLLVSGGGFSMSLKDLFLAFDGTIKAGATYDPPVTPLDEEGRGNPYAFYTYGVQAACVRVNTFTGKVAVRKVLAVYDAGTVINPVLFTGQVEGGIVMGAGFALGEEIRLEHGRVINPNFDEYMLLTSVDAPEMEVVAVEEPDREGPFGAKGIGEPALVPTAGAIANAVSRATGGDFRHLPLSLEEVTSTLAAKEGEPA